MAAAIIGPNVSEIASRINLCHTRRVVFADDSAISARFTDHKGLKYVTSSPFFDEMGALLFNLAAATLMYAPRRAVHPSEPPELPAGVNFLFNRLFCYVSRRSSKEYAYREVYRAAYRVGEDQRPPNLVWQKAKPIGET